MLLAHDRLEDDAAHAAVVAAPAVPGRHRPLLTNVTVATRAGGGADTQTRLPLLARSVTITPVTVGADPRPYRQRRKTVGEKRKLIIAKVGSTIAGTTVETRRTSSGTATRHPSGGASGGTSIG